MARRGWARSIFLALLSAAGMAAAQLGLGYGLGIISWIAPTGTAEAVANGAWSASLAWATWVGATSVVVGAVVGDRAANQVQSGRIVRISWRVMMVLAATLGALVMVPLVAVPARGAEIVDNFAPHLLAGIYATAGVVLGLILALFALTSRAVAANIFASAAWLWILAIVAVVDGVAAGRGLGYAQLGVWKFTDGGPMWHSFYIPGALLMLGAALLVGGLAAFPAAGRGDGRVGIAISGAAGPLLVAVAYVLASPRAGEAPVEQMSAYHTSPYMVLAGLAGSLLVAVVGGVPSPKRKSKKPATPIEPASIAARPISPPRPDGGYGFARPLPAASPNAITAKASVPASSRVTPPPPPPPERPGMGREGPPLGGANPPPPPKS